MAGTVKWGAVALAVAIAGCEPPNTYVEPPPPEVTVASPVQRKVVDYLEFTGMTQPLETIEIRARVKGFLKEKHFEEGSEVKKGQLLLVIDEEPFQVQLEAAQTKLHEAEATLAQATSSKSREVARAELDLSESLLQLARQDEIRGRQLFEKKVNTQADLDQLGATRKTREADVESAKAKLDQVLAVYDTSIQAANAQVATATNAVRSAKLDLSYCRMYAPVNGRISRINVDIGNLVGDGASAVLATIMRMDPLYVYATVSESDVEQTPILTRHAQTESAKQPSVPVDLGLASRSDYPFPGRIDYTDPSLDPSTGTLRLRARFDNPNRALMPGMFVRLRVSVGERPDALLVPERALGSDQSGQFLLVVGPDNVVEYRPVKAGTTLNDLRVVEGKLGPKDQVIVEGLLRARPGMKVTPKAETETKSAAGKASKAKSS